MSDNQGTSGSPPMSAGPLISDNPQIHNHQQMPNNPPTPEFGPRHGYPATHGYPPAHSYCPAHCYPQLTAASQLTAAPMRPIFHQSPVIHYPMVIPTWSLTAIRQPSIKHIAQSHSPALVPRAWPVGNPDPMPNSATYQFLKVPHLNIRALTFAIPCPPRPQKIIQSNHTSLLPTMRIMGKPIRIYSHQT